jgi:uncharacterized protein YegL
MKNKKTIYHFVVDQSGSMSGSEGSTIEGFNSQINTIKNLQKEYPQNEYIVSVTYFEDEVMDIIKFAKIDEVQLLTRDTYKPGGLTALLDGIGHSIEAIKERYEGEIREDLATVVMVILTDGGENASQFFHTKQLAGMIKELDENGKWTFSFLGADLDAVHASANVNIRKENIISFSKRKFSKMMDQTNESIIQYEKRKAAGKSSSFFFDQIEDKDQRED